jgi:undecaprenyl-diphosphatase
MIDHKLASRLLFGTAALAALGFVALTRAVVHGKTERFDRRAKRRVHGARVDVGGPALRRAALTTTPLGKWWGYLPPALATARRLQGKGRSAAALTVAGVSVAAALMPPLLKRVLPPRLSPPERGRLSHHCYPSGHALQTSAVALATSYVLTREGLASRWSLAPFGLTSLAAGVSRLVLDRHWTSDVIGGYCAGIALAAAGVGLYETAAARH